MRLNQESSEAVLRPLSAVQRPALLLPAGEVRLRCKGQPGDIVAGLHKLVITFSNVLNTE